jgi:Flp pilus assembly protein TadD
MASRRTSDHPRPASAQPSVAPDQRADPFRSPLLRLVPMVAIFAAVMLVYWPALDGQFINWDDPSTISDNPNFRGLTLDHVRWMFSTGLMGHYQPLAWLTFAMDFQLWQMRASGYHLTSVILHGISAVLVYVLTMQLMNVPAVHRWVFKSRAEAEPRDRVVMIGASLLAALLFAVHPMRVESVVWITERRDVLSGLFALACVIAYLHFAHTNQPGRSRWWYALSLIFFVLALLSKAITLTLPAILVLLDVYPLGRLRGPLRTWFSPLQRAPIIEKLPFVVLSVIFAVVILTIQTSLIESVQDYPLLQRIAQAMYGLLYYPRATLWPAGLLPLYELPRPGFDIGEPRFVISGIGVGVAAISGIILMRKQRWPGVLVAGACYVICVGPVLGLLQTGPQFVADRYSYLSMIAPVIVLAIGVPRAWHVSSAVVVRFAMLIVPGAIIVALAIAAHQYSITWQNSESLWGYTLAHQPDHALAHALYGAAIAQNNRQDEAVDHFQRALELRPDLAEASLNLAKAFHQRGEIQSAQHVLREALAFHPNAPELHRMLGDMRFAQDDPREALEHYRLALSGGVQSVALENNIGLALAQTGELNEAINHLRRALQLDPLRVPTYVNLASTLMMTRDPQSQAEAQAMLDRALELDPQNAKARVMMQRLQRE